MTLTKSEIAIVKDAVVDTPTVEYLSSPLDPQAPIDWAVLSQTIRELGPFRVRSADSPYTIEISVHDCTCDEENCDAEFALIRRRNGLFSIQWMLSPEEVVGFENLDHLRYAVLAGNLNDSCAERQIIEGEVERVLGKHYLDVRPMTCLCTECLKAAGKDLPLRMLLSQMASNLSARLDMFQEVRDQMDAYGAPDEAIEEIDGYIQFAFDHGYQLGRQYSEYQVKRDIEEDALAGRSFDEWKAKRAQGAGVASAGNRLKRITALLSQMEILLAESAAVARFGPEALAKLACEDAVNADPALWSQGAGQVLEYLGEIRRGEVGDDLKARYFAMFPAATMSHQRH